MSILLDSSILVAAIAEIHPQHKPTLDAYNEGAAMMVYDHSLLEAYRVLTYPNVDRGGYNFSPAQTVAAVREITVSCTLVSLTATQRLDALTIFAAAGVVSARIYDAMIGHVGILHGARAIMTLNAKNFQSLFPQMKIIDPSRSS